MIVEFEMTKEECKEIMDACRPIPIMDLFHTSAQENANKEWQENANRAWERLAKKLSFKCHTARPVEEKDIRFFTAEV